jgi:hypothetical protein
VIYGAGDWESVGRLTLRRVRALFSAWELTPPVAVSMAAQIGHKPKRRVRIRGKKQIAALIADFKAMGGSVGK